MVAKVYFGRLSGVSLMKPRPLKIQIAAIPPEGLEVSLELGEDWFRRWQEEDQGLEFAAPGNITGLIHLERHGRDVLFRGRLEGELKLPCSRCLAVYAAPVQTDFDLLLVPGPEPTTAEEELSSPDLDLDYYAGEVIDLESIIREQIILLIPLKPLCRETCQGLCPRCGADLNREPCTCKEIKAESPLAALAKLKV